jgi:poly(A) polymerase
MFRKVFPLIVGILEQKVIPFEKHQLPIDKVDTHALYVMEKLKSAGYISYLVGGSVRDLLLGATPKDIDISTSAKPEEIKKVFRNCILIGKRFRLAHIRFGKKILEVSTFRSGDPQKEELILRDNQWGYPEEDALRRDFTINGLMYDPFEQTIIDYVGGYEDIQRHYLRSIGPAFARFKQDPVRMLRLLKFQARFGFEIDPDALIALVECREEITKSSPARVLEEMLRMLESGASKSFIELLTHHGLMAHLLPDVAHFIEKETGGGDIYPFLDEIDRTFQDNSTENFDRSILMSALVFPLMQQTLQKQFLDRDQVPHLGQIQIVARDLANIVLQRFFQIPRRLRFNVQNILHGQYRLTPLTQKSAKRRRVPKDGEFALCLDFLRLRACLEPGLQKVYDIWSNLYDDSGLREQQKEDASKNRRRRRRKPRSS